MNICGYSKFDMANGPGIRVSLYVSGCTLKCKGCFNQDSWEFDAGELFDEQYKQRVFDDVNHDYIAGISILGGDPLEKENIDTIIDFCCEFKQKFPEKTIWLWTGRKQKSVLKTDIVKYVDVIISEPYKDELKCEGRYFGSSNQIVWNAKTGELIPQYNLTDKHNMKDIHG